MRDQVSILIVDDSVDIREMLQFLLVAEGYSVQVAPDASTSLSLLSAKAIFDFILLDLSLPDLGGEELIQKILGLIDRAKTQLILFSARSNVKDLAARYKTSMIDKPFKVDQVLKLIRQLKKD